MKEFEKWLKRFYKDHQGDRRFNPQASIGWRAALKWYQSVAKVCEKDCETSEDYKVLYFHLKQVLKNEVR